MKSAKTKIALAIWLTFWVTAVLFMGSWSWAVVVASWTVGPFFCSGILAQVRGRGE